MTDAIHTDTTLDQERLAAWPRRQKSGKKTHKRVKKGTKCYFRRRIILRR